MCGVFGIRSTERDVARLSYFGLFALQHRGQEAAGIAVSDRGRLTVLRDMGLVAQVFDEEKLQALPGQVAIGHTRYSTTGSNAWANAQPLVHHGRARTVAIGHNGNLTNTSELRVRARRRPDRARRHLRHRGDRGADRKRSRSDRGSSRDGAAAARGRLLGRRAVGGQATRVS